MLIARDFLLRKQNLADFTAQIIISCLQGTLQLYPVQVKWQWIS